MFGPGCAHTSGTWLPLLLLSLLLGCAAEERCAADAECGSGRYCVQELCIDGTADPDMDGLNTALELSVGLSPVAFDTDGDGIGDGLEWGPGDLPLDGDGDGLPDALESAAEDADADCLPDSLDPDNESPTDLVFLKETLCPRKGVCDSAWGQLQVVCRKQVPVCEITGVEGYQADERWCDGLDNDCDGAIDEGAGVDGAFVGQPCLVAGVCGEGVVECSEETREAVCSSGPGGSGSRVEEERCDGLDNDCDGETDEGMTYDGAPLGTDCVSPGICGEGTVECRLSDGETICSTMAGGSDDLSEEETCDGIDNDCDGEADEGLYSPDLSNCPDEGVCLVHREQLKVVCKLGSWICDPTGVSGYSPGSEAWCDGQDNDCDGATDEDFQLTDFDGTKKALTASCGTGPCIGGIVVCGEDGAQAVCSTWSNVTEETCDLQDNDCDGAVDEDQTFQGLALGETCKGVGVCGVGFVECSPATKTAVCSSNPGGSASQATPEVCDQLDNDCDGEVDEEAEDQPLCVLPGVCQEIDAEPICELGEWTCDYSFVPGWEAAESTCDGEDNDCDGLVDEKLDKLFAAGEVEVEHGAPPVRSGAASWYSPQEGRIFYAGGRSHPFPWQEEVCLDDLWALDPVALTWERLGTLGMEPRHDAAMAWEPQSGLLTVIGGRCGPLLTHNAWQFDPQTGESSPVYLPEEVGSRFGHALFLDQDGGRLVVVGGKNGTEYAEAFALDGELQPVETLEGAPAPAFAAWCTEPASNIGYLFGGITKTGLSDTLWAIDLTTLEFWEVEAPLGPSPRHRASMACAHDALFLFGGVDQEGELLNDPWVYELEAGKWFHGPAAPEGRKEALLVGLSETLLLTGGTGKYGRGLRDAWSLDEGEWTNVTVPSPGNLAGAAYAVDPVARRACVVGGFETGVDGPHPNFGLWCRPLAGGPWEQVGDPLSQPAIFSTLSYDPNAHRFLLVGGAAFPTGSEPQPLSPVCRYLALDLATGSWSSFAQCGEEGPGPLSAHAAAVRWKDLSLWVFGGLGSEGLSNRLWRYGLDTGQWEEVFPAEPSVLPGRYGHAMWMREEEGELLVAGSASSSGAAFLFNINTKALSAPISVPGWFDFGFATGFYDADSEVALLLHTDAPVATQVVLDGSAVEGVGVIPVPEAAYVTAHSASFTDRWQRHGLRFGGVDEMGLTRGDFTIFHMKCK